MSKVSKTDLAYTAAMVDGEGHFSISHCRIKSKAGNSYWAFDCRVGVSNTSVALMEWLKVRFGGEYHDGKQGMNRPCYRWNKEGYANIEKFILSIMPYLVIKREQAQLVLEFVRTRNQKNPARRLELCLAVQALNRGETPTTNTSDCPESGQKIESDLTGDRESDPVVTSEVRKVPLTVVHYGASMLDVLRQ